MHHIHVEFTFSQTTTMTDKPAEDDEAEDANDASHMFQNIAFLEKSNEPTKYKVPHFVDTTDMTAIL